MPNAFVFFSNRERRPTVVSLGERARRAPSQARTTARLASMKRNNIFDGQEFPLDIRHITVPKIYSAYMFLRKRTEPEP
jgi:hypothetical protein